ncbi:hypothetical protein CRUP_005395 [Coryphaenoides rupestris]|nr:hypothetical protein CRUP_005395 [Coryphaenoides rupestris]
MASTQMVGCSDGKIDSWLRGYGKKTGSENSADLNAEYTWRSRCEDDLGLGAEASAIRHGDSKSEVGPSPLPPAGNSPNRRPSMSTPRHKPLSLNLGNSMASGSQSSSTIKPDSSVSEVLQSCSEDAEETLLRLGFGRDEPHVPARVPMRFFTFPSQLQGINFRLFLQSQLQRIREEDPNLSIASRFRQVEALTAMANAFYSLYSHVSRTPLPKLMPLEPARSPEPVEMPDRFRGVVVGSDHSEPRSPVARLKETVARMCLYTGGARRDSERDSERKRPSLPEVVDIVLENAKLQAPRKLDFSEPSLDVQHDPHRELEEEEEEEGEHGQQTAMTDVPRQPSSLDARCHMVARGTVDQSDGLGADRNGATSSADLGGTRILSKTCEPLSSRSRKTSDAEEDRHILSYSADPHSDKYGQGEGPTSADHPVPHSGPPPCCITFTGWEGDNVTSSATHGPIHGSNGPIHGSNGPEQARRTGSRRLLCPLKRFSDKSRQANSFDIEEVSSAGEEDFGQSEMVRGDSLQSDSSGYADEDTAPLQTDAGADGVRSTDWGPPGAQNLV